MCQLLLVDQSQLDFADWALQIEATGDCPNFIVDKVLQLHLVIKSEQFYNCEKHCTNFNKRICHTFKEAILTQNKYLSLLLTRSTFIYYQWGSSLGLELKYISVSTTAYILVRMVCAQVI